MFRKERNLFNSSDFIIQQGHEDNMKVISIQIKALSNILVLHTLARHELGANFLRFLGEAGGVGIVPFTQFFGIFFWKEYLIDNDIVRINTEFGEFLYETFRFVNGKEFRNADADLRRSELGGMRRLVGWLVTEIYT